METKKAFFQDFELVVFPSVYEPQEDSFILAESIKAKPGVKALDIGCGSGIQAVNMALQGAEVLAVDINPEAVKNVLENARLLGLEKKVTAKKSDLFSKVEGKFGLICFNPPYVPGDRKKDRSIFGGRRGWEVLHAFLDKAPGHLKKGGECFFICSSLNDFAALGEKISCLGLRFEIVSRQKLFFEELAVFRVFR
ncbi:MAG: methyltransferase [Candidatus Diapherotrites archaeon]|nr:methyltransferase [Candidatus Diapherotrites archaeon]